MFKKLLITIILYATVAGLKAQYLSRHANGMDHDHYSIESVDNHFIMAGTVYPAGMLTATDIHVQRLNAAGQVLWETYHDIGSDERCLDMTLHGKDYILLTGSTIVDGKHRIFVMRLKQTDGSLVDMNVLYHEGGTDYIEQVGTDIIYSPATQKYFIVGWGSESFSEVGTITNNEVGLLISLNNDLSFNWSREIGTSLSPKPYRSDMRSVNEIPGVGLVVNGNSYSSFTSASSGATCFDYSGSVIWSSSHSATRPPILLGQVSLWQSKAGFYDALTDRYYYAEIHPVIGSYLVEVSNASSPFAAISRIADYTNLELAHKIVTYVEYIDINYATNTIVLAGNSFDRIGHYLTQEHRNTFINVDRTTLAATSVYVHEAHNPGITYHDHPQFSAPWNFPRTHDRFAKWQEGYVIVNYDYGSYSGNNIYNLAVSQTNFLGQHGQGCENQYSIETFYPTHHPEAALISDEKGYDTMEGLSEEFVIEHEVSTGCTPESPCAINISSISRSIVSCYEYEHTVNVSAGPGSYIYAYEWDFGDGSTATTTGPTANHDYGFQPSACTYQVCVTVKAIGADGNLCQQTYCASMIMLTYGYTNCSSCGLSKRIESEWDADSIGEASFYPNPANMQITFSGFENHLNVTVSDLNGKVIMAKELWNSDVMDIATLPAGTYLVIAQDGKGMTMRDKLVIVR